ncbi:MAG: hypothetical protein H6575_06705 [Lewinellaceae bacterium]|nr:hypothetical protein [Lewinellaceae bacterium]
MKKISTHNLKHTLRDIHKNTESRKFCFVIGAGASLKSGIPTGNQLAENWFKEIKERYSDEEIKQWKKDVKLDEKDLAAHYGAIYRKRFESDKTSGYEFLVQKMRSAKPTFGHIVLAQILAKTAGHTVLTTNFDSLIETSIYQFTNKTPLVCGHESLSGYARPSNIHPLIIKIHRDLLLSPKSDIDEISKLDKGWKEPLDNIFSSHIPIVIGYGGNDGSLMSYFEQMNKPSNFFWCGLKKSPVSHRVESLIKRMDGNYVEINGFDEIMHDLLWVFDEIKPIKEELDGITKVRIEAANNQLNEIITESQKVDPNKNESKQDISAFEYSNLADKETDYEKKKAIYLEALDKFPKTAWLWNAFTYFMLFIKKDFNNLEKYFLKALAADPEHANNNGNYAVFLQDIKKDYENAEKYFLKALAADPEHAYNNGNYAAFLKSKKKDYENAEKYYLKALAADPGDANINGNYAIFLKDIKKDYENVEKYHLKALAADPGDANINGNYAIFLRDVKKDYENAEKYYLKALSADPGNANINGSYAVFLKSIKKDYKNAEKYFLKALSADPKNANINGNYAQLLLITIRKSEATKYLEIAFQLNKDEKTDLLVEIWFYRYAHYFELIDEAEKKIGELLKDGIRSIGWDLSLNVKIGIESGHPEPKKLNDLAEKITKLGS